MISVEVITPRPTATLKVANTVDRQIQVGSHYQSCETDRGDAGPAKDHGKTVGAAIRQRRYWAGFAAA